MVELCGKTANGTIDHAALPQKVGQLLKTPASTVCRCSGSRFLLPALLTYLLLRAAFRRTGCGRSPVIRRTAGLLLFTFCLSLAVPDAEEDAESLSCPTDGRKGLDSRNSGENRALRSGIPAGKMIEFLCKISEAALPALAECFYLPEGVDPMKENTIGSLIAALRRNAGMTQRELAERLNVSDKSVSRWERGESMPDLALIPLIAELFGVTSDELLRGQLRPDGGQTGSQAPAISSGSQTRAQNRRLLEIALSRCKNRSLIASGIALAGLLTALSANFVFHRAWLGFLLGAVFVLGAVIVQIICVNNAFLATSDKEQPEDGEYRRAVLLAAARTFTLAFALFVFSLALIFYPRDAHVGLTARSLLLKGTPLALVGLAVALGLRWFAAAQLLKKGIYSLPEEEAERFWHNRLLQRNTVLLLAAVLVLTAFIHSAISGFGDPLALAKGITFEDTDAFKEYMAQDVPAPEGSSTPAPESAVSQIGETIWYDEQGNIISDKTREYSRTFTDAEGNELLRFIDRNRSVYSCRFTASDGVIGPITVYTWTEFSAIQERLAVYRNLFILLYVAETVCAILFYRRRRRR